MRKSEQAEPNLPKDFGKEPDVSHLFRCQNCEDHYAAGLKDGARRERMALLKLMEDCWVYDEVRHIWRFNKSLLEDKLKTLDAKGKGILKKGEGNV